MNLRTTCFSLLGLAVASLGGCGSAVDSDNAVDSVGQAQDNGGTSEPDRCGVKRDGTGEDLGEGTIDINGMCCVPQSDGSKHCYGCGDGFTCTSIPSTTKSPRKGPIVVPPTPPVVRG